MNGGRAGRHGRAVHAGRAVTWKIALEHEFRAHYVIGQDFSLTDLYRRAEDSLQRQFPSNNRVRATMRNVLQQLRNDGLLLFVDNDGTYRRLR